MAARKWIAIGCSYAGALSAWIRNKYPSLIDAAVVTCAAVHSQIALPQYIGIFANACGEQCVSQVRKAADHIFAMSATQDGRAMLGQTFNTCQPITKDTLFEFFWQATFEMPLQENVPYLDYPLKQVKQTYVQ